MYIPIWFIIISFIAYYYWSKSQQPQKDISTIEYFKLEADRYKKYLFEAAHFDSPRIIDLQDKFEVMESNYFRLKQKDLNNDVKQLELAKEWAKYIEALYELKQARVILDVDMSDDFIENFEKSSKESYVITDEVEKKYKTLLGRDFHKLPLNYDERKKKAGKKNSTDIFENWEKYYEDSPNFFRIKERRAKERKENSI